MFIHTHTLCGKVNSGDVVGMVPHFLIIFVDFLRWVETRLDLLLKESQEEGVVERRRRGEYTGGLGDELIEPEKYR